MRVFRDKQLIETMASNLMTTDPCQLTLTIEGSERSSRHDLGSIDADLKPMQQQRPAHATIETSNSNAKL